MGLSQIDSFVPLSLSVKCNLRDAGVEALQVENWSCFSSQTNFLWLSLPFTATLHPEIIEVISILITCNLLPVDGDVEGAAVLLQLHLLLLHLFLLTRLASLVGHQGVGDVDHLWYVASKKGLELGEKIKKKGSFQLAGAVGFELNLWNQGEQVAWRCDRLLLDYQSHTGERVVVTYLSASTLTNYNERRELTGFPGISGSL